MSFTTTDSLEVQIAERKNGVAVVELSGRLDSTNASHLDTALVSLIESGATDIILSCRSLRYVSSAGLSVFLKAFRALSEQPGGQFLLCCVADNIQRVLQITGFADFIPMCGDVQHARRQLQHTHVHSEGAAMTEVR